MADIFTNNLSKLLIEHANLLVDGEELTSDTKAPASVGDILRSEKYWETKFNNSNEKWKNTNQKISIKQ